MTPTRWPQLLILGVLGAVLGWVLAATAYAALPPLPLAWPITLAVLAAVEALLARSVRARLEGRPGTEPLPAIRVARTAALARASSAVGALLAGGYVGFGVVMLASLAGRAYARDARTCLFGLVAGLLLVAAALWLERSCRARRPPDEPPDDFSLPSRS